MIDSADVDPGLWCSLAEPDDLVDRQCVAAFETVVICLSAVPVLERFGCRREYALVAWYNGLLTAPDTTNIMSSISAPYFVSSSADR